MALYNVGLNGLIGGLGSLINQKDRDADFETFARGFYKGAAGGYLSHIGFTMTHRISKKENIAFAWPARLVNSLGSSMVQNAAENRKMFERLHFNLLLTRLEYNTQQRKFKIRLFTSSLYGLAVVGRGARFDLGKTLKSGIFYFESEGRFSSSLGSGRATGQVSSIGMRADLTGSEFYDVFAEEVAHIIQYDRKVGGNAFAQGWDANLKESSQFYRGLAKYVYFDLNGPIFWLAYKIEDSTQCHFFEQEAVNYANKRLDICN
ncbi:MAG: hypothetical protein Roseis2KO_55100 [Roseivirga sp.]